MAQRPPCAVFLVAQRPLRVILVAAVGPVVVVPPVTLVLPLPYIVAIVLCAVWGFGVGVCCALLLEKRMDGNQRVAAGLAFSVAPTRSLCSLRRDALFVPCALVCLGVPRGEFYALAKEVWLGGIGTRRRVLVLEVFPKVNMFSWGRVWCGRRGAGCRVPAPAQQRQALCTIRGGHHELIVALLCARGLLVPAHAFNVLALVRVCVSGISCLHAR